MANKPLKSKIYLVSLGCSRNRVDSEAMLGILLNASYEVTSSPDEADIIIINTCSFIDSAKEESVQTILELSEAKEKNPGVKLVVTGCLVQRYQKELPKDLPEVDLFIGTDEFPNIKHLLENITPQTKVFAKRSNYIYDRNLPRLNTLSKYSAYVKISEGCQHACSFCVIPKIRGKLRSRAITDIVKEVTYLAGEGVLEINLVAQDLMAFGLEKRQKNENLICLLKSLVKINDLKWIRLLYAYPENISEDLLKILRSEEKIIKYLDVPVQHSSQRILDLMKRPITGKDLRSTIYLLRKEVPGIALRTSVMVGFPGEREEDFLDLKRFVQEMRFENLGCFMYSQEEGTLAAKMPEQIKKQIKLVRYNQIMKLQQKISQDYLQGFLGKKITTLVEGRHPETEFLWQGRASFQAPEIDGNILINDGAPRVGFLQNVLITETHEYDLVGKVLKLS